MDLGREVHEAPTLPDKAPLLSPQGGEDAIRMESLPLGGAGRGLEIVNKIMNDEKKANLSFWIKLIIAVLTGIGSALATSSCMAMIA